MPFDANLFLLDGTVDLTPATDIAPTSIDVNVATGFKVLDFGWRNRKFGGGDGIPKVSLTMFLPTTPTTYLDELTMYVEQSDRPDGGYMYVADFPDLFTYVRVLEVGVTTAFVAADYGGAVDGATTLDTGILRWMGPSAYTVGAETTLLVSMDDATDTFDNATEVINGGTTGVGVMRKVSYIPAKPPLSGPGTYVATFGVSMRYLRLAPAVSGGGNFGKVSVWVNSHPNAQII